MTDYILGLNLTNKIQYRLVPVNKKVMDLSKL